MDAINGMRQRLHQAKEGKEKVKIIFQYPASSKAIIKSGNVIETYEDSFLLDEKFDGEVIYSYNFIAEIKSV